MLFFLHRIALAIGSSVVTHEFNEVPHPRFCGDDHGDLD